MKEPIVGLSVCAALLFGLLLSPNSSQALTCKQGDFAERVSGAKNVVVVELLAFGRKYPRTLTFRVVNVLKNGGFFGPGKKAFQVVESRYTSMGRSLKKGQLFLMFHNGTARPWMCNSPILLH